MIRFVLSFILAMVLAFLFYSNSGPWAFLHAGLGFAFVVIFDLLRVRRPAQSLYVYLLGTFFRIIVLGVYGVIHMFAGVSWSGSALLTFASVLFACLFFGVAWEAGASIHSHRR